MRTLIAAALISTALAGTARASDAVYHDGTPDPGTAQTLSVVGTLAGWGMLFAGAGMDSGPLALAGAAGIAVGPSIGHFYAGETRRGLVTAGVRVAGEAAFMVGLAGAFSVLFTDEPEPAWAAPAVLGGLVVIGATTIWDVVDARGAAVRERNRRRTLLVTPAPVVGPRGSVTPGLTLAGTF